MPVHPKIGTFILGACHAGQRLDLMRDAGINFTRMDVPFPLGEDGGSSPAFKAFGARCEELARYGIEMMGITPFPMDFISNGIDPSTKTGLRQVEEICALIARELKGLVQGWQVCEEMNTFYFREPLSLPEAHTFLAAGLRGLRRGDPDAFCGINAVGTSPEALGILEALRPYRGLMDYVGIDSYCGTWYDGEVEDILGEINRVHELMGLPVIVQEFGFASRGEIYTEEEAQGWLRFMGFANREAVLANPEELIQKAPYGVARIAMTQNRDEWGDNILSLMPHIMKKWPGCSKVYRHTPEGQAAFFKELLPQIIHHPHVYGAFIYRWSDIPICTCGDSHCCCETSWGMMDKNENPKPLYYLVRSMFGVNE